jgi:Na+/melibiose symporter-like transporter
MKREAVAMRNDGTLSRSTLAAYGIVSIPLSTIGLPLVIYLAPFYAGEVGLPLAMVGTVLFLARFADLIVDPAIGILSDRTRSRFGRRKSWILPGSVIMAIGIFYLFMPESPVTVWYLLLWSAVVYIGSTMIGLPFEAWGAELSQSYHERTRINGARQLFNLIGLLIATLYPAYLMARGGTSGTILAGMGYLFIVLLPICVGIALWRVPEPPPVDGEKHVGLREGLRVVARNRPFKLIALALLIAGTGESFRITITVFFARDFVGAQNIGMLYVYYFALGLLSVPVWVRLSRVIGKHQALCLSFFLIALVGIAMYFVKPGQTTLFTVLFALKGFCFGAFQLLPEAMIADVADVDRLETGEERQGAFYAYKIIIIKFGQALGQGLSLNLLAFVGYQAAGGSGSIAMHWLTLFYTLIPSAFFVVAILVLWKYPLTAERHSEIRERLAQMDRDRIRLNTPGHRPLEDGLV